jgi:hypothetical protein
MQSLEIFSTLWILALYAVFFAAFIRGLTGFGFALILAPLLLLFLSPISVVIVNLFLGLLSNILVIFRSLKQVNLRVIFPLVASSLVGIPIGIWIISTTDPSTIKIIMGAVIVSFTIPIAIGFHLSFSSERLACSFAGFLSGILASSTSLAGPPVVLFMHGQNWPKEMIHSSLAVYFTFVSICSLLALSMSAKIDVETIVTAASLTPGMVVGVSLGMIIFHKTGHRFFRSLSIAVVICAGILAIVSGLGVFP